MYARREARLPSCTSLAFYQRKKESQYETRFSYHHCSSERPQRVPAAWAVDYPLPPANSRLIGENQFWTVQEGDRNLQAIARRFDTAAMLILEANETIAPVQPKPGTQVLIPSQMLLPDAA